MSAAQTIPAPAETFECGSLLQVLQPRCLTNRLVPRIVVVAAHPDDETIGAGAQLPDCHGVHFIHVTDGAPRNLRDCLAAGCATREDYAKLRRRELELALAFAGVMPAQLHSISYADQEASLHLADLALILAGQLAALRADVVLTHAYEGGHPDHDAVAFAVHAAHRILQEEEGAAPLLLEMTSYHNRAGIMATCEFLPCACGWAATVTLTDRHREFKRKMYSCFASQQEVLKCFPIECELFRAAPAYDFTSPPHDGALYYEMFDWGMTGKEWRALAHEALADLC